MKFTDAEREELENRVRSFNVVKQQMESFMSFLGKQYDAKENVPIKQDLSGFEEVKKTKKVVEAK